jgi:hypothetical protein
MTRRRQPGYRESQIPTISDRQKDNHLPPRFDHSCCAFPSQINAEMNRASPFAKGEEVAEPSSTLRDGGISSIRCLQRASIMSIKLLS